MPPVSRFSYCAPLPCSARCASFSRWGLCLTYGLVKMSIDMSRDPNISASALGAFISALLVLLIGLLADGIALRLGRMHQNVTGVPMADELGSQASQSSAVGVGR